MTTPTHRVVGGAVDRHDETLEPGDECVPSEAELRAFGDRFDVLPDDGADDADEPAPTTVQGVEENVARTLVENAGYDPDDYSDMQELAAEYDNVPGNLAKDALLKRLGAVLDAE